MVSSNMVSIATYKKIKRKNTSPDKKSQAGRENGGGGDVTHKLQYRIVPLYTLRNLSRTYDDEVVAPEQRVQRIVNEKEAESAHG